MENEYVLSPVFCLHNGAVILAQDNLTVTVGIKDRIIVEEESSGKTGKEIERSESPELKELDELKERISRSVRQSVGKKCLFVEISEEEYKKHVSGLFGNRAANRNVLSDGTESVKENEEKKVYDENQAKALLESLVARARSYDATDIHIENGSVRFRVKGQLRHEIPLDSDSQFSLVQRIKLLSKLNVVEKRRGQDGQFIFSDGMNHSIFVRVSCLPAVARQIGDYNESVVLRLLDPMRLALNIDTLGFKRKQVEQIRSLCSLKDGLVLVCGPTGSGKSTTACAMLEEIKKIFGNTKKIISLEDPPEYVLEGVTQVQVNNDCQLDFLEVLKRSLRQDPDVMMIGEIRDEETARIALQSALTGHLVFATMHTSGIAQAVLRLCDLGGKASIVNDVVKGIVVQHLEEGKLQAVIRVVDEVVEKKNEPELEDVSGEKEIVQLKTTSTRKKTAGVWKQPFLENWEAAEFNG